MDAWKLGLYVSTTSVAHTPWHMDLVLLDGWNPCWLAQLGFPGEPEKGGRMERLTYFTDNNDCNDCCQVKGADNAPCCDVCDSQVGCGGCPIDIAMRRLEAYEDTGLAPEEIMDGKMLTGWIPVEERLPEGDEMVLVTCQTKKCVLSVNRAYCNDGFWRRIIFWKRRQGLRSITFNLKLGFKGEL